MTGDILVSAKDICVKLHETKAKKRRKENKKYLYITSKVCKCFWDVRFGKGINRSAGSDKKVKEKAACFMLWFLEGFKRARFGWVAARMLNLHYKHWIFLFCHFTKTYNIIVFHSEWTSASSKNTYSWSNQPRIIEMLTTYRERITKSAEAFILQPRICVYLFMRCPTAVDKSSKRFTSFLPKQLQSARAIKSELCPVKYDLNYVKWPQGKKMLIFQVAYH